MEFRLLGPLEIELDAMQAPTLARSRERCLLAVLLVYVGQTLSAEKLISYVWDDDDLQGTAEGTFRAYLSHVKNVVDATGGRAQLVTREGGYQLRVPPGCVDVHRFSRLRHQADVAIHGGNADQAVALLCEAEALWRGPALAGLNGRWASATRIGLEEERRACVLKRIGLELDLGRHAELVGELRLLSAQYPLDEACVAFEMTALYRSGRQADALDAYRQARVRFIDQGIEPGPELAALHQRILQRDPQLSRLGPLRQPPSPDRPAQIPLPPTAFVGRAEEVRMLTVAGPGASRVRIITGLPGIGKTRLAVEAAKRLADRFPDGQLYLEFHAHEEDQVPLDAHGALRRLLEMTGVQRSALPHGKAEMVALWQEEMATRQMIIILDDVPDAGSVIPLLQQDGSCCVFITARHRLRGIADTVELALDVLPEHDAITLFSQIAGTKKDVAPDAAAAAVRLCGCLPLAITLTASRLREDGNPLAEAEPADGAAETRVLPGRTGEISEQLFLVLESSYKALTVGEQRLFRFLGMNPCPAFTAESAAVTADLTVHAANRTIASLLDRHLVEPVAGGRFRLHDLLRSYAAFRAEQDIPGPDRRDAERRLLGYYLHRTDRADRDLYPHRGRTPLQATWPSPQRSGHDSPITNPREWLESEWRDALKAAEHAGRHEWKRHCAELAHVLAEFLDIRGYWEEAVGAHSHALRACRDLGDQPWIARALIDLSRACQRKGLCEAALVHVQEALDIYRATGDRRGEAAAADRIGAICYYSGKFRETLAYEQEARSLYAQSGDLAGQAEAIFRCGVSCMELGRLSESLNHFRESLAIFEHSGNQYSMAKTLNSIAEASRRQGYHREAIDYYQKALSIYRSMGARQEGATVMQNIGQVHLYKGNPERALAEFRCALAIFREIRDLPGQARAMCDFGDAYLAMDEHEQCLVYYQNAASTANQVSNLYVRVIALRGIADAHRGSDRPEEAMRYYQDALKLAQEVEEPYQHALILNGIAETMFRTGRVGAGRIYLRQAYELYQMAGAIEAKSTELRLQILGDPGNGNPLPASLA
jgi:DNA-binding SARP family transcriptional activator/tetratricopeptide (TPR) repeat protein